MAARTPPGSRAAAFAAASCAALLLLFFATSRNSEEPQLSQGLAVQRPSPSTVNRNGLALAPLRHQRSRLARCTTAAQKQKNSAKIININNKKSVSELATLAAMPGLLTGAAHASDLTNQVAEMDVSTKIISQGLPLAIAGVIALNLFADPERRRAEMTQAAGGDEMASVKNYFNGEGFQRWRKIYGETDEVNKVQLDIRDGHAETVSKVLTWLKEEGGVSGVSVCDAGCGTGSLTVPLALQGAKVSASDIAVEMTKEAKRRYEQSAVEGAIMPEFEAKNLEEIDGKYDVVTCLDVMIHYPDDKAASMVKHLASLADKKLIISFAPKTLYYSALKKVGELFPGPSKATRAYLHAEEDVEKALNEVGWKVVKREMTATSFYFSRLLEAVPM